MKLTCLTPITLYRPDVNLNNGGFRSDVVPCGRCPACLKRRSGNWTFRLEQEYKRAETATFLTLTYDEDNIPTSDMGHQTIRKKHLQDFHKRLRTQTKRYWPEWNSKLTYYAVGEYGSKTHRPHYHSIMFNCHPELLEHTEALEAIWQNGLVHHGSVNSKSISYVTGYVNKTKFVFPEEHVADREPEFSLMSKGIGANYLTDARVSYYQRLQVPYLIVENGEKRAMPRYYKDKIYDPLQKYLIGQKAKEHCQDRFDNPKHQIDYIANRFKQHKRKVELERQTL